MIRGKPQHVQRAIEELREVQASNTKVAAYESARVVADWLLDDAQVSDDEYAELADQIAYASVGAGADLTTVRHVIAEAVRRQPESTFARGKLILRRAELSSAAGDYRGAFDDATVTADLARQLNEPRLEFAALLTLSVCANGLNRKGELQAALDRAAEVASLPEERAYLLHMRGAGLQGLYSSDVRIGFLTQAVALNARYSESGGVMPSDPHALAMSSMALGHELEQAGRYEEAIPHLERAMQLCQLVGEVRELPHTLHALLFLDRAVGRCDDDEFDRRFEELVAARRRSGDAQQLVKDRLRRVDVRLRDAPIDEQVAELRAIASMARAADVITNWQIALLRGIAIETEAGLLTGDTGADARSRRLGELEDLRHRLVNLRSTLTNPAERAGVSGQLADVVRQETRLAIQDGDIAGALRASDNVRSYSRREEVYDALVREGATREQRGAEQALLNRIATSSSHTNPTSEELERTLRTLRREMREQAQVPPIADTELPTELIDALSRRLKAENEALLVLAFDGSYLVGIAVNNQEVQACSPMGVDSSVGRELPARITEFRWSASQACRQGGDPNQPIRHGHWLWRTLLEPFSDVLGARDVVIVADGILATIPWAALLTEPQISDPKLEQVFQDRFSGDQESRSAGKPTLLEDEGWAHGPGNVDWKTLPLLAFQRRIRTAESLSAVIGKSPCVPWRDGPTSDEELWLLSIANPLLPSESESRLRAASETRGGSLGSLRGADTEAEAIKQALLARYPDAHAELLSRHHASRDRLLQEVANGVRVLHVAAHGIANSDDPLRSRLLLAESEAGAGPRDITAAWLYTHPLSATLAILACCDSALGKTVQAEPLLGIPRALLAGNVDAVIASLWPASDDPRLVSALGKELATGKSSVAALTAAQQSLAHLNPAFWAGYLHVS